MSDLEGLTRNLLQKGYSDNKIIKRLIQEYVDFKEISEEKAKILAEAVLEECKKSDISSISDPFIKNLLSINNAGITIGDQGVGCRGAGDFFVHKMISEFSDAGIEAYLSPKSLDDAGAVLLKDFKLIKKMLKKQGENLIIVSKMEGIHSRLSDFPFICGFHVTRAALRDLYVKGAIPISILVDVHLGDDADVGKLFDFMSGITAVCQLSKVPLTAGSTLRIGGDMVIGNRLTGGIGGVGIAGSNLFARRNINPDDRILMTEGAGGGTISTTAIYSGNHEVVKETMNIKFLEACNIILNSEYKNGIHAMCDVTNGGLRGDLYEINYESNCGVTIYEEDIRKLVNTKVLDLLENVGVDYLGVSLDALLIYCSKEVEEKIIRDLTKNNINCVEIGYVDDSKEVTMVFEDKKSKKILPKFRESAYTKIKQEIGEETPEKKEIMQNRIEEIALKALEKRKKIVDYIKNFNKN
ncbi:MAG: hypothetical protein EU518_01165 [Promethearchaeota archaeon]|nr:MAG: hypothetical protein EU518_01165 [Candidatus Lokiarchaeota archaeon]